MNYLIDRNLQVSYLVVDEADMDIEMAEDPFIEAGIQIPRDLPKSTPITSIRLISVALFM